MESPKDSTSSQKESLLPAPEEENVVEKKPVAEFDEASDSEKESSPHAPEEENISIEDDYLMEYSKDEDGTSLPNELIQPEEDIMPKHEEASYVMHSDHDSDGEEESFSPVRKAKIVTDNSPVLEPSNEPSDSRKESFSLLDDLITGKASAAEDMEAPVDAFMPRTPDVEEVHVVHVENVSPVVSELPSPIETDHSVPEKTYFMEDPFVEAPSVENTNPTVAERAPPTVTEKTPAREKTSPVEESAAVVPPTPVLAPQVTAKKSLEERVRALRESRKARMNEKTPDMEKPAPVTTGKGAFIKMREKFTKFRENYRAEMHYLRSYQPCSDGDEVRLAAVSVTCLFGFYVFLLTIVFSLSATSVFPFLKRFVF
ncbi:hypothetical protein QBC45DRAFT_464555 [Copromyces sp. CBS 386.78]|nr:hypothetical protein QBC45DRAFT_464555 [Copromyces sp. CBS 386.78]